ncbi:hypothetical protein [Stratiformator vulcanicus]|uniref:Uncharacterized protein n=1 Tax=Stratiformator vulcanicus TaxID=2527980 RepID=A0A517R3R7_9PLAN|nr:hypothetical protein [Stratiformator vulcanicus]QDT38506.1 hypothetical protein Pan189_29000 [Stratiformator vulcanicus]
MAQRRHSRKKLIQRLRGFAKRHDGPITMRLFCLEIRTGPSTVGYYFKRGWPELCRLADLPDEPPRKEPKYSAEQLLRAYGSVGWYLRRSPTLKELAAMTGVAGDTWLRCFRCKRTLQIAYTRFEIFKKVPDPLPTPDEELWLPDFLIKHQRPEDYWDGVRELRAEVAAQGDPLSLGRGSG